MTSSRVPICGNHSAIDRLTASPQRFIASACKSNAAQCTKPDTLQRIYRCLTRGRSRSPHNGGMFSHPRHIIIPVLTGLAIAHALAHSYGPPPRVTAGPGDNPRACTQCHGGNALNSFSGSVKVVLQSGPVYIPGVKQRVIVQVADPGQQRWGFELSARLNSNPENGEAGDLVPIDNFTQVVCEDNGPKPCSSGVSFIQHTSAGTRNGT